MKKIFVYICLFILVSCFSGCSHNPAKSKELSYEEELAAEKATKDSLRLVNHKRINDSLMIYDKGRIVDSIYLGMTQSEYYKYMKILRDKVDGTIEIAGINFDFDNFENYDSDDFARGFSPGNKFQFGSDNKLHVFGLKTEFEVSIRINEADQSKNQVNDPGEKYIKDLVDFFSKKYGEPDSIINDRRETCHILDADYILWIYSTRVIEICPKIGEISIRFFEPSYYKELREREEMLKSKFRRANEETHEKRQKYGDQL